MRSVKLSLIRVTCLERHKKKNLKMSGRLYSTLVWAIKDQNRLQTVSFGNNSCSIEVETFSFTFEKIIPFVYHIGEG